MGTQYSLITIPKTILKRFVYFVTTGSSLYWLFDRDSARQTTNWIPFKVNQTQISSTDVWGSMMFNHLLQKTKICKKKLNYTQLSKQSLPHVPHLLKKCKETGVYIVKMSFSCHSIDRLFDLKQLTINRNHLVIF